MKKGNTDLTNDITRLWAVISIQLFYWPTNKALYCWYSFNEL